MMQAHEHSPHASAPHAPHYGRQENCSTAEARFIERLCRQYGFKPNDFLRGHRVGPYALALYCPAARLAFEIEACASEDLSAQTALERADANALRRAARDSFLQSVSIEVLRVPEDEIETSERLEALVVRIGRQIERHMRAQREREQAGRTLEAASVYGAFVSGDSPT